jgi:hypothetical protein
MIGGSAMPVTVSAYHSTLLGVFVDIQHEINTVKSVANPLNTIRHPPSARCPELTFLSTRCVICQWILLVIDANGLRNLNI